MKLWVDKENTPHKFAPPTLSRGMVWLPQTMHLCKGLGPTNATLLLPNGPSGPPFNPMRFSSLSTLNLRGGTRKVGEQERNRRKKKGERARKKT